MIGGAGGRVQLVEKPQPLLGERQRQRASRSTPGMSSATVSMTRVAPRCLSSRSSAARFNWSRLSLCSFNLLSILGDDSEQFAFRQRSHFLLQVEQFIRLVLRQLQGVDQIGQGQQRRVFEQPRSGISTPKVCRARSVTCTASSE